MPVTILVSFAVVFMFGFIIPRAQDVFLTDLNKAILFHSIGVYYLVCVFLSLIALFKTYTTGPGYAADLFKSVKLEPVMIGGA